MSLSDNEVAPNIDCANTLRDCHPIVLYRRRRYYLARQITDMLDTIFGEFTMSKLHCVCATRCLAWLAYGMPGSSNWRMPDRSNCATRKSRSNSAVDLHLSPGSEGQDYPARLAQGRPTLDHVLAIEIPCGMSRYSTCMTRNNKCSGPNQ